MKQVNNKTTQDIIRWLTEYKSRLVEKSIKTSCQVPSFFSFKE